PFVLYGFGELRPAHLRHGLVGNDQVDEIFAPHYVERFLARISFENSVTKIFEHGDRIHEYEGVVVPCQDRAGTGSLSRTMRQRIVEGDLSSRARVWECRALPA